MKEIKLTQGQVALVDDEDFEELNKFKWSAAKNKNTFYANHQTLRKNQRPRQRIEYMHRVVSNATPEFEVDHIDGNGLNNQKSNLRLCTHLQNMMNRKLNKNNKSGFKGIQKSHSKWRASINANGKRFELGSFLKKESAVEAYTQAAKKYHGEFTRSF